MGLQNIARFQFYFLTENYESQINKTPIWNVYQYLTAVASRRSLF